jgi:N-acetyl sugar amidotransferase
MKYCKRCLYPENHPLGLTLNNKGICSGCQVHEEKDKLDWSERLEKLKVICDQYRNQSRSVHDCIIPVTGARDSYFIVDFVINELKMRPLLVNYNSHYNTRMGIRNLAYLSSLMGADFMQCTVSPERVKKITRETLKLRGSMYWHVLAGQTVFPVRTAVQFKIPLIIWGAHQGVDQVGMFSHLDEVEMTRKYRKEHDLMCLEAEDLLEMDNHLTAEDLEQFMYSHDKELEAVGVRGVYLNNYLRWDSKAQHERMIEKYGYETMQQQRTFDTYNDVDSFHYSGIHDEIKMIKYGYGKVTDHACREIRLKRMTREEGISLVKKYQFIESRDISLFLNWLNLDEKSFWGIIENFHSKAAWTQLSNGKYELKDSITNYGNNHKVINVALEKKESCVFQVNSPRDANPVEDKYILIGRGWIDKDSAFNS